MPNTALNRSSVQLLTNKSGGATVQGAVVVIDGATASSFATTTTEGYVSGLIGVVIEPNGIANNATGLVAFGGYVPKINLDSSASLGHFVKTDSIAGQGTPHASPSAAGDFAQVLATGTTPAAILVGLNYGASGGSDTTAIHDNLAAEISAITEKTALAGTDKIILEDSAAGDAKKMAQIANVGTGIRLDDLASPDDNTDLNALTTKHGLLKKLDNDPTHFMNGQGNWVTPSGGGIAGAYDIEKGGNPTYTDAGMSDEFNDGTGESGTINGLAVKWTAVGGGAGTIDLYTDNIADSVYDLDTRPGTMLVQSDIADIISFRQDDMLIDGESIVVSMIVPSPFDAIATNNTYRAGIVVNDDNTQYSSGNYRGLVWDGSDVARVIHYTGSTVYADHTIAPAGGRCYFRISRVSSVLHLFFSKDGILWIDCASVAIGTFDNFWIIFDQSISSADGSAIAGVEWVRHVASTALDLW